jgi:hypothetical protein
MSNEIITEPAPARKPAPATTDLSAAIDESISREPGEEVRTVRVFGDNYRCNWWIRDPAPGPIYLNVGRIVRSKFLRATMKGDVLVIDDVSCRAAP